MDTKILSDPKSTFFESTWNWKTKKSFFEEENPKKSDFFTPEWKWTTLFENSSPSIVYKNLLSHWIWQIKNSQTILDIIFGTSGKFCQKTVVNGWRKCPFFGLRMIESENLFFLAYSSDVVLHSSLLLGFSTWTSRFQSSKVLSRS